MSVSSSTGIGGGVNSHASSLPPIISIPLPPQPADPPSVECSDSGPVCSKLLTLEDENTVLCILPGQRLTLKEFVDRFAEDQATLGLTGQACAVALDGVLKEPPFVDHTLRIANLDHHEGVSRLETPSTAPQSMRFVESGELERLTDGGRRVVFIYGEDADLDFCLGLWPIQFAALLRLPETVTRLRPLVQLEDRLDRWCGASPLDPSDPLTTAMVWINEPYVNAHRHPLFMRDARLMHGVVTDVCNRISAFVFGYEESAAPDTSYEITRYPGDWALIRDGGYYARCIACGEGHRALLSVRGSTGQRVTYTLFRADAGRDFPVQAIQEELNRLEAQTGGQHVVRLWGGCKGQFTASPRPGTLLSESVITEVIAAKVAEFDRRPT